MNYSLKKIASMAPAVCALLALTPVAAHAQAALSQSGDVSPNGLVREGGFARDRNVGVRDRPRPEYETGGVPLGAFQLLPSVTARVGTNDNIFATKQNPRSDVIYRLQPGALVQSQWSNHEVLAFAAADIVKYQDTESESRNEWIVGATGRLDVRRDTAVAAGVSYQQLVEPRTSSGSPVDAAEPVEYTQAKFNVAGAKNFNRLRLAGRALVRKLDYDDVRSVSGGIISQKDRNSTEYYGEGRLEYAVSPAASVFVSSVANHRNFEQAPVGFPPRDSSGYEVTVGTNLDLARLVRGEVMIGYLHQNYKNAAYGDVSGLSVRGSLDYFVTPLVTLGISGQRRVEDAAVLGAGGYLSSNVGLQADYELRRNIILTAGLDYRQDDYEGLDRKDETTTYGLSAIYLLNRAVSLTGLLQRQGQDSTGLAAGPDFDVNRAQVSIVYQF